MRGVAFQVTPRGERSVSSHSGHPSCRTQHLKSPLMGNAAFQVTRTSSLRSPLMRGPAFQVTPYVKRMRSDLKCGKPFANVMTWKHFPGCWPFVNGIHWWPVDSLHKGPVTRVLMLAQTNGWINSCRLFETPWRSCDVTITFSSHISTTYLISWFVLKPRDYFVHGFFEFEIIWFVSKAVQRPVVSEITPAQFSICIKITHLSSSTRGTNIPTTLQNNKISHDSYIKVVDVWYKVLQQNDSHHVMMQDVGQILISFTLSLSPSLSEKESLPPSLRGRERVGGGAGRDLKGARKVLARALIQ